MPLAAREQTFKMLAGVGWHDGARMVGVAGSVISPLVDAKLFFIFCKISLDLGKFS
jgi:hypothetical protein